MVRDSPAIVLRPKVPRGSSCRNMSCGRWIAFSALKAAAEQKKRAVAEDPNA
jgi:hypothetical protein